MTKNTKIKIVSAMAIIAASAATAVLFADRTVTEKRAFYSMSTTVTVQLKGKNSAKVADEIEAESMRLEAELSLFREGSEIESINGGESEISKETYDLLTKANEYSAESGGLFDVTIGALTKLWNIMSDNPRVPAPEEISETIGLVDYTALALWEENGRYLARVPEGASIDLGGIAKGYALDCFREIAEKHGIKEGFVSIGGNVLVIGDKAGQPFTVGLKVPVQGSGEYFCALLLKSTVVSTAGGYERFFVGEDGKTYHHVLDPRTGYPAQSELVSVSVVYEDAAKADYLSTRLFVAGLDEAIRIIKDEGLQVIMLTKDGTVYASASLEDSLPINFRDETLNFIFI